MHSDAKSLILRGNGLFSAKRPLDSRNQELANHFYPERADFTTVRSLGADWADHLMTGYPSLVRRDLGHAIGSMLRPRSKEWMHMAKARGHEDTGHDAAKWLEWATGLQRRAMYDRISGFERATKEGDHDFACFGGAVISTEVNLRDSALLYRCWHLRDTAWSEDQYGQIGQIHRNWEPTAADLCNFFPKTIHDKVRELKEKEPGAKVNVRHVVLRSDDYDNKFRQPWTSVYIDTDNQHVLEERGSWTSIYTIPRWATLAGSQYPYSPAALIALPDARLIQAMTLTLLDVGERIASPPMIGVSEAIRGDLQMFAGGFTSVDAEYDERLGEVLRPLTQDKSGLPFGQDMLDRTSGMIREAFFLNTLSMPPAGGPDMTAYEVGQRVQEYIRQALPLFEPMEAEYNGALCDITFETLRHSGAFGAPETIPEELRGQKIQFRFESPLNEMVERQKGQKFLEAKAMIAEAMAVDPQAHITLNTRESLRDVLQGIGVPAKWMRSAEEVEAMANAANEQAAEQASMQQLQSGADVAATLSQTAQAFNV